ncbi:MAG: hypothetical protein V2I39_12910 [Erythrobacter sp.]|nr:hypothetical protein [Erythrobacter sp.]
MNDNPMTAEMALALYSSTASTLAVHTLAKAGLVSGNELDELIDNLLARRDGADLPRRVAEHFAMLVKLLVETRLPAQGE